MNTAKPFAQSFSTGKSTFKSNNESSGAGDYILKKKANAIYCNYTSCADRVRVNNYHSMYLLEKAKLNAKIDKKQTDIGPGDLNINLFTKLDLENVCTIQLNNPVTCPTSLDVTQYFPVIYTIDPTGALFGNSICGTNNFQNYLVPNSS